jgi:hypothetical protein
MMHKYVLIAAFFLSGCIGLTLEEAKQVLEETKLVSQTSALTSSSVEICTNFTIGDAVQQAAEELRDFIASQLPCAEITIQGGDTLIIDYGVNPGDCRHNGHTFSGSHTITIERNERSAVQVSHTWDAFSNQVVQLDGEATVTWDFSALTRRVVHANHWTRLADGRTGDGSGDRLQEALEEGILSGFRVDGERTWIGEAGEWNLDIDNVEMRWIDAVPQSGTYKLDAPFDKSVTVRFERVSDTQIKVTIEGPRNSFDFNVTTLGG